MFNKTGVKMHLPLNWFDVLLLIVIATFYPLAVHDVLHKGKEVIGHMSVIQFFFMNCMAAGFIWVALFT